MPSAVVASPNRPLGGPSRLAADELTDIRLFNALARGVARAAQRPRRLCHDRLWHVASPPMSGLTKESHVPLDNQLRDLLAAAIRDGDLIPGDRLPSESELGETHGVSRITVRQALRELELAGMLLRIAGKGTFVRERLPVARLTRLSGFGDNMRAMGRDPGYRVLACRRATADDATAVRLRTAVGALVMHLERVFLADGQPVALARSVIPASAFEGNPPEVEDLATGSLYTHLADAGIHLAQATEAVEPAVAGTEEAALLDVEPGQLLLQVQRLAMDASGRPIEDVQLLYVASRYTFMLRLSDRDDV